jgi:hypothetical protein
VTAFPTTVEEMEAFLKAMPPDKFAALKKIGAKQFGRPWNPQPGPQTEAYFTQADETLYGGAAGGGKSDLVLGLATTQHERSLIFRRQANDLEGLWVRLEEIVRGRVAKSDANKKKMRLKDNRFIEFGHLEKPGSEKGWMGRPHDLIAFDEAAQLDEMKVAFVTRWLRSTTPGQRKRVMFSTNPPIPEFDRDGKIIDTGTGAWVKEWFAPWLEETYPDPARPGELRWCYMIAEGDRMLNIWVEGPGGYPLESDDNRGWVKGQRIAKGGYTEEDVEAGLVAVASSRTFIKSLLKDNAFLRGTGYAAKLSTTPEPLKSLLLNGSFTVKGEDHPFQIISTLDVLRAQDRFRVVLNSGEWKKWRQLVLFGDVAQGGMDMSVLESLLENDFFEEPFAQAGRHTPTGKEVRMMVLAKRRDNSLVGLDGTGGWGGSTRDLLEQNDKIIAEMLIASAKSTGWTSDQRYKFGNQRAEMWWTFREALQEKSGYEIKLPLSTRVSTQLTAPIFVIKGNTIFVEEKEELRKRLGSSTDEADAIIGAWFLRDMALQQRFQARPDIVQRIVHGITPEQLHAAQGDALPFDDPLGAYR